MSVVQTTSVIYKKQYVFKINGQVLAILDPAEFTHYKEGKVDQLSWKWIHLPMKTQGKDLNKLIFHNYSKAELDIDVLVRYEIIAMENLPLVYFSPSKEALIYFNGDGYRLFGGVAGRTSSIKHSTILIDLDKWSTGIPFPLQPLTKQSHGWGIEYSIALTPGSSGFIYEWEFINNKLHEIEELHSQYQDLLGMNNGL